MHSYLESDVIDTINAKYGTNFTNLTMQKVTGIAIGDDYPNWNAYEKIRDTNVSFKISATATHNSLGHIKDETLQIFTWAERPGWGWTSNDNGVISDYGGPSQNASTSIINRLLELGITIKEVSNLDVNFSIGEEIQDWDKYLHL